ncbi:MAG: TonB-dependent receptor plug domain-containing protein [Opitutaceae bacterium]|jgi:outer membrane receptor protein involved in Fe transport|nr:TonB-dependent receptor plug domain-containing protein [Opitutaceae bacterium]
MTPRSQNTHTHTHTRLPVPLVATLPLVATQPHVITQPRVATLPLITALLLVAALALSAQQTLPDNDAGLDDEVVILDEFQVKVTANRDNYIATDTIGVRTAARLTETPYSIQSLTSEFINDFQLFELADQLDFVAGGFPGASDTGANNGKAIRGFNPPVLRDGFSEASPPHHSLIDRVEIIRGPASALFGQAEPGGIINYVSKRPVRRSRYLVRGAYSPNYNNQSLTLTASGPLLPGKLFYLSNFSYNYAENPLDYFYRRSRVFALALTWSLSPRTLLTLALEKQPEYSNQGAAILFYQQNIGGTNYLTGRAPDGLEHFNAQGPYNHLKRDFECANLLIEHRFSPNLILRANLQTYDKRFDQINYRLDTNYIHEDVFTYNIEPRTQDQDSDAKHVGFDLNWRKQTGAVWHSLLLVGDYHLSKSDEIIHVQPGDRSLTRINPHAPEWLSLDPYDITQVYQRTRRKTESHGLLLSHRAFLFRNRLITMASLRYDKVRRPYYDYYQNSGTRRTLSGARDEIYDHWQRTGELPPGSLGSGFSVASRHAFGEKDDATTFSVGANLKLLGDALVLYANYGTGFTISNTYDQGTGEFMPNITSRGVELGFKGGFLDDRLIYTLSAFNIKKKGMPVTNSLWSAGVSNPDGSPLPQYLGAGIDRVKGLDGELKWGVTPGLTLTIGGAYMDPTTFYRETLPAPPHMATDRMINIPRVNAYATANHTFRTGALKGLRLGASINHQGDRLVGRLSGSRLRMAEPSNTLVRCFAGYSWRKGKWQNSFQININNLFDKQYWSSIAYLGRGREITLAHTLSY